MSVLNIPTRALFNILGSRTFIQYPTIETKTNLKPVKLAFASYEDTSSRDVGSQHKPAPLVIMHGLFGSKSNWNSICKALHQRIRPMRKIIAVDARNHGDSPHSVEHSYPALTADVCQLLQAERIPKVTFLGHSMGGRVGMYLALQFPKLVEQLITVDISPIANSTTFPAMAKYMSAMGAIQLSPNLPLSAARATANAALMRTVPDKNVRAFLLTNLVQQPDGSFKWRINISALKENYPNIAQLPIDPESGVQFSGPTTFIVGGESDFVSKSDFPTIKKLFPSVKFRVVPKAGHWLHSEKPTEFIQILLELLNEPITSKNNITS